MTYEQVGRRNNYSNTTVRICSIPVAFVILGRHPVSVVINMIGGHSVGNGHSAKLEINPMASQLELTSVVKSPSTHTLHFKQMLQHSLQYSV